MTNSNQKSSTPPVDTVRVGRVSASIWQRHDSEGKPFYNVTVSRSYRDGDDTKYADSFGRNDLLLLEKVVSKAFGKVLELEARDRASASEAETGAAA